MIEEPLTDYGIDLRRDEIPEYTVELPDFSEATDREILQWALFKIGLNKDPYYRISDGGYYIELFDDGKSTFGYSFDKDGKLIK